MESENIPLSDYLRTYPTMPPEVADYAKRLEDVSMAGALLAAQIRRFVSKNGAGRTAEDVEAALREHDRVWDALAQTPGGSADQPIDAPVVPET